MSSTAEITDSRQLDLYVVGASPIEPAHKIFECISTNLDGVSQYIGYLPIGQTGQVKCELNARKEHLDSGKAFMFVAHGFGAAKETYDSLVPYIARHQPVLLTDEAGLIYHHDNIDEQIAHPDHLQTQVGVAVVDAVANDFETPLIDGVGHSQGFRSIVQAARLRRSYFRSITSAGGVGLTGHDIVRVHELVDIFSDPYKEGKTTPEALIEYLDLAKTLGRATQAAYHIAEDVVHLAKFVAADVLGSLRRLDVDVSWDLIVHELEQLGNPGRMLLEGLADNGADERDDVIDLRQSGIITINAPLMKDGIFTFNEVISGSEGVFDYTAPFNANHLAPQLYPEEFVEHLVSSIAMAGCIKERKLARI